MPSPRARIAGSVAALAGIGVLAGATAGCAYRADVANGTDARLLVSLVQIDPVMEDWVLESREVNPGESVRLGPRRVPLAGVAVVAHDQTDRFIPARRRILPGLTRLEAGVGEDDGRPAYTLAPPRD
jgi:hypothetical protein